MTNEQYSRRDCLLAAGTVAAVGSAGCTNALSGATQTPPIESIEPDWTVDVAGYFESDPVIAGDTLYVGANEPDRPRNTLYALDHTDGSETWTATVEGGLEAPPTVADGVVYAVTNENRVYAFDASEGTEQWQFRRTAGDTLRAAPAVAGDTVYVGALSTTTDGRVAGLYALNRADGSQQWMQKTRGGVGGAPVVVDDTIYSATVDGWLTARNTSDGTRQWRQIIASDATNAGPVVVGDTIYAGGVNGFDGAAVAIDRASGDELWRAELEDWPGASVAVAGETVYVGIEEPALVYALRTSDGSTRWSHELGGQIHSQPVVTENHVYVAGDNVLALDRDGGTPRLRLESEGYHYLSTIAEGTLYVVNSEGRLQALPTA
ncbi:outer membrane protein assembly factor BamB family protein [Salinirussus salinus]|jgi:outer membrane protein assembly factor BamB|uniref:outer membrane protein assembly factor BamB family protein n=1 Tax=Salinirussus salinus TaxID=1198300 RepID=UPI001358C749|nr:PQQ-binding-like beta-propeller repeat protein [Salinirussus salinus]